MTLKKIIKYIHLNNKKYNEKNIYLTNYIVTPSNENFCPLRFFFTPGAGL